MPERSRVLILFTGGTISMKIVPGRGAVPARSGREILSGVPGLDRWADVSCDDFDRLPGPHWTCQRMLELAHEIDGRLSHGDLDGAVVTHGTDTLEETAYLLDLVLSTPKPVVLTGAMKTVDDPVWDGPGNLIAATRVAADPASSGRGALVVLDDTVHAARHVTKAHTESFAAFSSGEAGPEGSVDWDGVHYNVPAAPRERYETTHLEGEVALVTAAVGMNGRLLECALEQGARGVVIEAMGRGNVPPTWLPAMHAAADAGVPVVVASRCRNGRTAPRYAYDGGGRTLRDAGAVFAGALPASKARVKLMVLLGAGRSSEAIRVAFEGPAFEAS